MKFRTPNRHMIDFIFPIAVFFVFAASSLAVLMLAANIYHSQTTEINNNYMRRTALAYVNEKIRQNDSLGGISIQTLEGQECLSLASNFGGTSYTTYIYEYNGMLKELFIRNDAEMRLKDGTDIMEITSFTMDAIDEHLFRFTSVDMEGKASTLIASERSVP